MRLLQVKPPLLLVTLGLLVHLAAANPSQNDDEYYYYDYYEESGHPAEPMAEPEPEDIVELEPPAEAVAEGGEATVDEDDQTMVEQTEPEDSETSMTDIGEDEEGETTEEPSTYMEEDTPMKTEPGPDEEVPIRAVLEPAESTEEELPAGRIEESLPLLPEAHDSIPVQPEVTDDTEVVPAEPVLAEPDLPLETELAMGPDVPGGAHIKLEDTVELSFPANPEFSLTNEIPIEPAAPVEPGYSIEVEPSFEPDPPENEEPTTEETDETRAEPTEETSEEGEEETDTRTSATPAATEEPSEPGPAGGADGDPSADLGLNFTRVQEEEKEEDAPSGGLDLDDTFLNLDESCTQLPSAGMCRGSFPMFYFDVSSRSCRQLLYGGCRGNANVHRTAADCYAKCHPAGATTHAGRGGSGPRGYLALHGGTGATTFTFLGHNAAARVDDEALTDFIVNKVFEFEFSFRTDSPHGLIAFLRQVSVPPEVAGARIQLYIYLKRGHLGVTHIFGNNSEHFLMKKGGLQEGSWHSVIVKLSAITGQLVMEVDHASQEEFTVTSLRDAPSYNSGHSHKDFVSRLWIGGVFKEALEREDVVAGFLNFHGCLKDLSIMSGETSEDMVGVEGLRTSRHQDVREKCSNNCADRYRNLCSPSSHCVEHFDHSTCNCFDSSQDGTRCDNPFVPVLTLSSDGYVVHRLYEWMDRVQSYSNLISIEFKTAFGNSILFYASAEHPEKQYLSASINDAGNVYVEANFGGGAVGTEIAERVTKHMWHKLTITHQQERVQVYLDSKLKETLFIPGEVRYLHLNPDFYVGNAPRIARSCGLAVDRGTHEGPDCHQQHQSYHYNVHTGTCLPFNYTGCGGNDNRFHNHVTCLDTCHTPGLRSFNTFLGCLRNVFYNDISIIQQLKQGNKTTRYYGITKDAPVSATCTEKTMPLVTLSTEKANIHLNNPNPDNFRIVVSFKPTKPSGVVASGVVDILDTKSNWEIRHDDKLVHFYVHADLIVIKPNGKIKIGHWQYVDLRYENGRITMRVNQVTVTKKPPGDLRFSSEVTIGASILEEYPGFIGCLRKLEVGGQKVDLRSVVGTKLAHRDVTFDDCKVLGPCERPESCEHGASCTVVEDGVNCDCTGTGYTGKKCHFSLFKKSCEMYRQIGYNTSGIYRIDVDGNGPLPPSFVKCDFSDLTGETTTIVEHNLPQHYDVRKPNLGDLEISVEYREFSPEMLTSLISQSKFCTQEVRYDCRRSPISLYKRTWFSSPSKDHISSFGSDTEGLCRCKEINACDKPDVACNCDVGDGLPRSDEGVIKDPLHLPVTSMVFLQDQIGQEEDSEAFISLGSLMCTKEATEKHTVSFKSPGSYLEVPAWREGSFFLSFKTTSDRALVAYQPAYHPDHATFKLSLVGERKIEFTYEFHGHIHHHTTTTRHAMNTGRWQQVLFEFYDHQLRLSVNFEEKIIDIDKDANLGVLDGSMFLGAIPPHLLTEEDKEEGLEGLVGCIRGLTLNDEVVNLKPFIRASAHGVSTGCTPSCDPNPCKNGAKCIEKWGTYECICKNPFAHSGDNCEKNINENSITFTTEDSKYMYFVNDTVALGEYNVISNDFLLNFRTHASSGLILFAHDYMHNFVQLYLAKNNEVVFMFNHYKGVKKMVVRADGGEVFNTGQSVEVVVQRTSTSTSFIVYTNRYFHSYLDVGLLLLEEVDYEQFPFGESQPMPEMVYYPHSVTKPSPFLQAYLGSGNDKHRDIQCAIPGFVGCVRGFMTGSKLVSLTDLVSKSVYPVEGIKQECTMACDLRPCSNGGVCTEDFNFYNNFQCDCSGTSYTGPTCSAETAYTFFGRQWISQDAATSPIRADFRFELAFSTSGTHVRPQLLALLRSTDIETAQDYLLVSVEPDGSLVVAAQLSDLNDEMVLGAKVTPSAYDFQAFNGYRHSVAVEKTDSGLTVKVDKIEAVVLPLWNVSVTWTEVMTTPTGLYLGGVEEDVDDRFSEYDNFHGCISNVRLRTPDGDSLPLQQYSDNDRHLRRSGMPGYGSCAGFASTGVPGILLAYGDNLNMSAVMGTEWAFMTAQRRAYHVKYVASSYPERDTRMDDVVPTVSGIIFLVSAILVVGLLLRSHFKRKKKAQKMKDDEELQPLFNGGRPGEDPRAQIFIVSEKEMSPVTSVADGISPDVKVETDTDVATKLEEVLLMEAPPASVQEPLLATTQEDSQEAVQVRKTKDSEEGTDFGERPLSWDKAADNLPLIIGSQGQPVVGQPPGDSSSESSIDCTINITGTPPSSPTSPSALQRPSLDQDSLSSTVVQRGSNGMINVDEDMDIEEGGSDTEPKMLKYAPLSSEYEGGQQTEEENVQNLEVDPLDVPKISVEEHRGEDIEMDADRYPQVGDEEVQKIVKDEDENEYVVVDDEPEEKKIKVSESTSGDEREEPVINEELENDDETKVKAESGSSFEDNAVPQVGTDDDSPETKADDKAEGEDIDQPEVNVEEKLEIQEDDHPESRLDSQLEIKEDDQSDIKGQPEDRAYNPLQIIEDHPDIKADDESDVKDDDQWEIVADQPKTEREVETNSELQVDTTPDSITDAKEEEGKVDADDTAKEEVSPVPTTDTIGDSPDSPEKVAEEKDTQPESSAHAEPTAEPGDKVPVGDEVDEDFIEMRPEHEDILDARRMTAKKLQEFDGHEPNHSDNLTLNEGGRVPSMVMGIKEEESALEHEDHKEMITGKNYGKDITEDTQDGGNEVEERHECDFKDETKKETAERVPVIEDEAKGSTSTFITPMIIISAPDEPLVFNSQFQKTMEEEEEQDEEKEQSNTIHAEDLQTSLSDIETSSDKELVSSDIFTSSEGNENSKDIIMGNEISEDDNKGSSKDGKDESKDNETNLRMMECEAKDISEEIKEKDHEMEQSIGEAGNLENEKRLGEIIQYFPNSNDGITDIAEGGKQESEYENDDTEYLDEARAKEQADGNPSYSSNFPDELSMTSPQQHTLTEGMSDEDWALLNQLSLQNKGRCGEDVNRKRAGSPVSESEESGENDVPTYLNYLQDDDICLEGPVVTSEDDDPGRIEDSTTPLETISEQDESDDEEDGATRELSSLRLKSKLSAGMYNLNTIAEDGADDFYQWDVENAGEPSLPRIEENPSYLSESNKSSSNTSSEEEQEVVGTGEKEATKETVRMRSKRGRIMKEKKSNPIYLSENLRTFGNPISYLGGPSIEYEEEEDGGRRTDSLISTTSLD